MHRITDFSQKRSLAGVADRAGGAQAGYWINLVLWIAFDLFVQDQTALLRHDQDVLL
jgi:hypothetical protein